MSADFSGTWTANLQKSKLLGPAPKAIVANIQHAGPQLTAEMVITDADGREHSLVFRGTTTGEEVSNTILGLLWRSQLRWVGRELLIESWVNQGGREMHFRDFWSLSPDGETLTMQHRDDDLAGQTTILERAR
jgi:hypothetical protein